MQCVLLVDDEPSNLESLSLILRQDGYDVLTAQHGLQALDQFRAAQARGRPAELVLTDLRMPVMGGEELIGHLLSEKHPPVVLIQSVVDDVDHIVQLMKRGVYDYLVKPYSFGELLHRVDKAAEYSELRGIKSTTERERDLRRSQRTNLRGSGPDRLLALLRRIRDEGHAVSGGFTVPTAVVEGTMRTLDRADRLLERIRSLEAATGQAPRGEKMFVSEIRDLVQRTAAGLASLAGLRSHQIVVEEPERGRPEAYLVEPSLLAEAVAETLVNALKFSVPGSAVTVRWTLPQDHGLRIHFVSHPVRDAIGNRGILPDYSHLVFEPFYRLSAESCEQYATPDLGLGLTLVDRVLERHGGHVAAYNRALVSPGESGESGGDSVVVVEMELKPLHAL